MLRKLFELSLSRHARLVLPGLAAAVALALVLGLSTGAREWLWGILGYGFIPVGLWIAALALALQYRRSWIRQYHGPWIGSALLVVAILGLLSFFYARLGVLEETGLSGRAGYVLGGEPIALGVLKVALALWLVPFAIALRWTVGRYRRAGVALGGLGLVLYRSLSSAIVALVQRLKPGRAGDTPLEEVAAQKASGTLDWLPHLEPMTEEDLKIDAASTDIESLFDEEQPEKVIKVSKWHLPSVDLLSNGEVQAVPQSTLDEMAGRIETTLSEHGVDVSVQDIKAGPRVVQFGLVPGWVKKSREMKGGKTSDEGPPHEMGRVKVHSILARERDLALALKTSDLRIESPVPGEALVGLEVPNPVANRVYLRAVTESAAFSKIVSQGGLPMGLGQGTGGEPASEDLLELPHLLVAGATGSGKSVCVNSMVVSLLMANRPDRLRMVMVDPKRVELTPFNGLPHLLTPVIVDSDRVMGMLDGLVREMFRRYRLMEETGVRNIDGYNRKSKEVMPYLMLIIDELADMMIASGYEVEQALVRLAQLGRATGIHLILCTQRPSVNVVTGLLKANIPARIAFAVSSQVDSRVILDGAGAEKLLGKGDMLFLSAQSPKPRRIQGTYVSDREIEEVVQFWGSQKGPPLPEISLEEPEEGADEVEGMDEAGDDLLQRAQELAGKHQHISTSLLQRRLQIGYPRAMHLMELLEQRGLVAGGEPGRSREVLDKRARSFLE